MTKQNPPSKSKQERRSYQRHGLYTMKKTLSELGSRAIDGRSALARGLAAWRQSYIQDLGGEDVISTAQNTLIEKAATTHMLISSIDAWIAEQPSIVNRRKRALFPIVLQRQTLIDSLARLLSMLGLERREKPVQNLQDYISEKSKGENHGNE